MWIFIGLVGGALAIVSGFPVLGAVGITIGAICQYSQRKDEEAWEAVQDTPVANVYPILSVIAAIIIAVFCFALLGLAVRTGT